MPKRKSLKSDVMVQSDDRILVADVSIRHENGDNLLQGRLFKVRKFIPLLPHLQQWIRVAAKVILPIAAYSERFCTV